MGQDRHDGLALRTLTDVGDDPPAPTAGTREHILQVDAADEASWERGVRNVDPAGFRTCRP
jgi:hypothetical protein